MTRRLVVTADDLGRDPSTTSTVLDLAAAGHITATTMIAVAPDAAAAVPVLHRLGLAPRLHLTLTSERGLAGWSARSDGTALPTDPAEGARTDPRRLCAELDAQLAWLRDQGWAPGGADGHAGTLYTPDLLPPTLQWCARHGLAFRLPRDLTGYLGSAAAEPMAAAHRAAVQLADALEVPLPATMVTNRASAAELGDYQALRTQILSALDRLPPGTSELFLHPADGLDGETGRIRAWEARLLRDPELWAGVRAAGLDLVDSWWDR